MVLQGQSRRVRVTVTQATTGSRLKMDCITSIAIGSIHVRNRLDDSLDSYQELDLERLVQSMSKCGWWKGSILVAKFCFQSTLLRILVYFVIQS